jgi:hypothetical protein
VRILWARGGEAVVESAAGESVVLRSTVAAPPGARVEAAIDGEPPATLRIKVHACRRRPEGDYRIEGRCIDLTRELRERLNARARDAPP